MEDHAREVEKQRISREGAENLRKIREGEDAIALDRINESDTPICHLKKNAQLGIHEKPSETPTWYDYISYCPSGGKDGNCAPTEGQMKGLKGGLILVADSTLRYKMGVCANNAISR